MLVIGRLARIDGQVNVWDFALEVQVRAPSGLPRFSAACATRPRHTGDGFPVACGSELLCRACKQQFLPCKQ